MMGPRVVIPLVAVAILFNTACRSATPLDAYGNVEAIDVVVGAEATGRVVSFEPAEGAVLTAGAVVGAIDTAALSLQRDQLTAEQRASASRVEEVERQAAVFEAQRSAAVAQRRAGEAQLAALDVQVDIARRTLDRTTRLAAQQAATVVQLDQAEREVRVLEQQMKAQRDQMAAQDGQIEAQARQILVARAQRGTASALVASGDARLAQLGERIEKSTITNPIAGTVLATYARAGEVVQAGQPLYKIADLSAVDVRAYVTAPQLSGLRIGGTAMVSIDSGADTIRALPGTVSWIAAQAEFTPTPIQTREERADLVYAVKIRVSNNGGVLKIGMPVDVQFTAAVASTAR